MKFGAARSKPALSCDHVISPDSSTSVQNILPIRSVLPTSVPVHEIIQLGFRYHQTGLSAPEATRPDAPGLLIRFTLPCQSDQSILANLLRHWRDLSFLTSGIPIRPLQVTFMIYTDASTQVWGAHMEDFQIWGNWTHFRPQAPYLLFRTQSSNLSLRPLGNNASHTYSDCVWITLASFHTAEICCHNRGSSRMGSRTICTLGGSHVALQSSRICKPHE